MSVYFLIHTFRNKETRDSNSIILATVPRHRLQATNFSLMSQLQAFKLTSAFTKDWIFFHPFVIRLMKDCEIPLEIITP